MPSYPHIERYYEDRQRLIEFGGSDNEQSIRAAFQNCLATYCRSHREDLELVPELRAPGGVIPDGTVKDSMRLSHGYWEAKDLHDNLDAEIQNKLNRGYPNDNILFENSRTAVLIQRNTVARRADMRDPAELHRIIESFLNFVTREVEEFREAWRQFKKDLPDILDTLREAIRRAAERGDYQAAATGFLALCHRTIGPNVSEQDVQEMLIQHILTKDIFLRVFAEDQYHQENNIARQLDALAQTFFTGALRRDTTDDLFPYYGAITGAAANIADYREKQRFLKAIYEDFYQTYNPAAADRLGVVYTPNEVVDFIIRGADHLLQKHFGCTLADSNVQILDPATGTGTFITSLIDYLPEDRLEYKYINEIHANEVAILPYYIANLNIEYSYKEKTGHYREFPNLCFVDTLDNMDWQQSGATDGAVQRQGGLLLGGLSEENWIRVQEQNEKTISVIIGNPPYNDQQSNWYDLNPNRKYPEIDKRIRDTYVKEGTAQRTHQYDMYKRFIRWASDRLADDGVIAFVNNSAFLDSRQDDGFRKIVADEFNELWVIDLKGNARTSGERRRREGGNIFDNKIRVGVAIYFLVRRQGDSGFKVFHNSVKDYAKSSDKVEYVRDKTLASFDFSDITPDANGQWLNQSNSDFARLTSLANRRAKRNNTVAVGQAVFSLHSVGISTNRDEWVYDFKKSYLSGKVRFFCQTYLEEVARFAEEDKTKFEKEAQSSSDESSIDNEKVGQWVNKSIKWTSELVGHLIEYDPIEFDTGNVTPALYRPFTTKFSYYAPIITHRRYQMPQIFPHELDGGNKVICFPGNATSNGFQVLATDKVFSHDLLKTTQCLPLYRYTTEGERVSNITQWGLRQFREHYGNDDITAEDIFSYTYSVLHDPVYREKYAVDLLREFPRLPFYDDFGAWAAMGRKLLNLHVGFELAAPYPLKRVEKSMQASLDGTHAKPILGADKGPGRVRVDEQTTLEGVPAKAWEYRLGSRSALEWVLDQSKEKKPRDPTIAERFNTYRFADHKEKVIDLLRRVCTVSVQTMKIVDDMAQRDDQGGG